jgi:hypothetical protein
MRIEDATYSIPRQRSERSRSPGAEFALPEEAALARPAVEDIVQLTLSREGIWEVSAPKTMPDGNVAASAYASTPTLPRMARLYRALSWLYSPAGLLHAMEQSRGLVVDLYV